MNERIKLVREGAGLTQAAFGQRIGLSRDVINNLERGRVEPKDHIIKLICDEYQVQEHWLRTGTGPMHTQPSTFSLDQFVQERGASDLELEIMKAYFELDPEVRKTVLDHFKARFAAAAQEVPEPAAREPSVEELEAEYKKSVLKSASNTGHTALNTTEGTGSDGKASAG